MNKKMQVIMKWIKYLLYGISWGWSFFVLSNIIGCLVVGKGYLEPVMEHFVRQSLFAALVGIGCGSTAIVYTFERIPRAVQIAIHFVAGIGTYFAVAFSQQWIPLINVWSAAAFVVIGIVVFGTIWAVFYFYNLWEARRVNEKLRQIEDEEQKK